jgi:protein-L-isoaspartate(D-aspartate) O-methyltransferase
VSGIGASYVRGVAIEIDRALAAAAAANLAGAASVEVRCGTGLPEPGELFDAILVNAGVTHAHPGWLDALAPEARMALPLTAMMPGMGATLGKGVTVLLTRETAENSAAKVLGFVAIYSALDLRDDGTNARLGRALMRAPWPAFKRLRCDEHQETPQCWLHTPSGCLSID